MKQKIRYAIEILLVIAAIAVAIYNFVTDRQIAYLASIIAVCGTVAILVKDIICILGLVACNKKSMNYIISNEASITGDIKKVYENSILIENASGEYVVSLKVENNDGIYSPIMVGDKVAVYFDGNIAESYPMQINTVYAILLQEPANHTVNEKP